jgi:hypothetical protein
LTYPGAQIINLPKILDDRGNLSFLEEKTHIPFEIKRTYWIYDVPGGEIRGSRALENTEEFIIALSGSFDVVLHDGKTEQRFLLNRSYIGIYVPKLIWRTLENFSTNSLALILTSKSFAESRYIRDFNIFLNSIKNNDLRDNG